MHSSWPLALASEAEARRLRLDQGQPLGPTQRSSLRDKKCMVRPGDARAVSRDGDRVALMYPTS